MSKLSPDKLKHSTLKKKFLSSYQAEINPMEAFNSFLLEIIKFKSSPKNTDITSPVHIAKKPKLVEKKPFGKNRDSTQEREDEQLSTLLQANKEKNLALLNSCKKIKQKMRLEKVDSAMKFFKHKVQPFSELKTFINAREFLEKVNPVQTGPVFHDNQYTQDKSMHTLQKLHRQSIEFFDNKNKELVERLEDLNQRKTSKMKKKNEFEEGSNLSSEPNIEEVVETPIMTPQNKVQKYQKPPTPIHRPPMKNPTVPQKSVFPSQNMKESTPILKNPMENMKKQIMKTLVKNDKTFNKKNFELENENICDGDLNEFYMNLESQFEKQKHAHLVQPENFNKELESLLRLEKMVKTMIQEQETINNKEPELLEKYKEFQQKAAEIIKMIGHTSRNIFNEDSPQASNLKDLPLTKKKNIPDLHLSSFLRQNSQELKNTSFSKDPKFTNLEISIPSQLTSIIPKRNSKSFSKAFFEQGKFSKGNNPNSMNSNENHYFSPKMIERHSMASISHMPSINKKSEPFIQTKVSFSPKEFNPMSLDHRKSLEMKKSLSSASFLQSPLSVKKENKLVRQGKKLNSPKSLDWTNNHLKKKEIMGRLEDIIKKANDVTYAYEDSRTDLEKLVSQNDKFFMETHRKIHPTLESLVMTLEKRKVDEIDKIPLL